MGHKGVEVIHLGESGGRNQYEFPSLDAFTQGVPAVVISYLDSTFQ